MDSWFFHPFVFLLATSLSFTIPGIILLSSDKNSRFKLHIWEKLILGTSVGLVCFTLLAYLLLLLNLTILLIPLIVIFDLLGLSRITSLKNQFILPSKNKVLLLAAVFITGIIGQMAIIAPSGLTNDLGVTFWSAHGHDGPWHLALVEEIKKGFPLQNPVFAGEKLVNYHFFSDIPLAMFNQYFQIPSLDLYFRYFPLLFSFLLGSLAFLMGKRLGNSFGAGLWAVIFAYFAGSFGYLVTLVQNRTIGGEALFWTTQIQSSIGNPPQIVAFIIVLAFLYLFSYFLEDQKNWRKFLLCATLAGSLIEFKVYGGIIILGSLSLVGLWQVLKEKKVYLLLLAAVSSLLSIALYLPNTTGSTGFLIWEPWWYIRTMIVVPGRLNLLDWELRRQTYLLEHNIKRVILLESQGFFIFLFGNLGLRTLGLIYTGNVFRAFFQNYLSMLFISILIISFVFPLLFLQKGVASNTIQFMQYFLLLMGIFAGITTNQILNKIRIPSLQVGLGVLIIILAVPTQLGLIYDFYKRPPLAKISAEELQALNYLKENTAKDSIVLTAPYNKYINLHKSTPPIWAWFDTSYIPAFAARHVYLADTEQVDIMGYNFRKRLEVLETLFKEENPLTFEDTLKETKVNYLYFPKILKPQADLTLTSLKQVYSNNEVEIWQVN